MSSRTLFGHYECPSACPAAYVENRADRTWKGSGVEAAIECEEPDLMLKI